ncbi:DUF327 family protein [Salinibacillus xinjiangensis]|uniref:DUF327 family protein n=1 Tax=Salinibacillus xinjiangensis TaxID=1229268 RepID=A0A6G1XB68_9BACI|nr:DUF327 family protein [Salinibacillus xinjiangensis]
MKISQEIRGQMETSQKKLQMNTSQGKNFESMVQKEAGQLRDHELNRLMEKLSSQGEKVARFRSFQDLAKYKQLVKEFVHEAVQYGMDLKQSRSFSMGGQSQKLTIVEKIDQQLTDLTETVLNQEKKSIDILDHIGEIKGLLMNLYT